MRRRELIAGLESAAAWPLAAPAQQGDRVRRIGVLVGQAPDNPPDPFKSRRLRRDCRRSVGPPAATCGSTTGGVPTIPTSFADTRLVALMPDVILATA
jgi:hypothetical protein